MGPVLVDTSVWVEHFRHGQPALVQLLETDRVLCHPWVLGELACGTPPQRQQTLEDLAALQPANVASLGEIMAFVEREQLFGLGCGLVDLGLLASTLITPAAALWTLDKRLAAMAQRFGIAHRLGAGLAAG
jgi:predicted nucleic acid-binding protein